MDYSQLRFVVEIVETGSISKAANNLFISQPNLSNQIASLEKTLGKKIFYRNNRGVTLTSYGVEVYSYAKALVEQYTIVEKKLMTRSNENKIKIASFGSEVINSQFFEICKRYNENNYEFNLCECGVEAAIQKVNMRDCDVALIIYSDFQHNKLGQLLTAQELELQNLFQGQLKIHVSQQYPLSKKSNITRKDLEGLFHVKKAYLFEGMFSLDYELQFLGIPENQKTILANGNKTYNDALHSLPSFAIEIDWKCNKALPSDLNRIPYENKNLTITCGLVKRKNEFLKEELSFFVKKLIDAYA
ncbi:ModE molybdate transport repressor domain-containing protein [Tindallia magadiensis]|uniref:ModE molybdate transport repressor domain-containing protein n=1 Tax=Tindallia magadiensis TaxID=69895 RepID=A0A1I3GWR8_9FIRM|nr:LysR family transcriptional regulator [Tindallia magadiensis]SFI27853.1 ModE molybdate transport repressor domain-containing protein [Tindallia magadiensis]